jgi:RNA polymerase sigma-70 factor, ECF subfamily
MLSPTLASSPMIETTAGSEWLRKFHAGDREVLSECYREYFHTVAGAVGTVLRGVDRENAIHELFYRLIVDGAARASFQGGSLASWLWVSARRHAVDVLRSRERERAALSKLSTHLATSAESGEDDTFARLLIERFRAEVLPSKWVKVFEVRFLRQQSQRDAAAALGMRRTTLAYQELRIRALLRRFVLSGGRL